MPALFGARWCDRVRRGDLLFAFFLSWASIDAQQMPAYSESANPVEQPAGNHLDSSELLKPNRPFRVKVPVGEAKFMRYNCGLGPADVVVSLSTYTENADPLMVLSERPNTIPKLEDYDSSSASRWREDATGEHFVLAQGVGPAGGVVGVYNMRYFSSAMLDGILRLRCTAIVGFDFLFWGDIRTSHVCPTGFSKADNTSAFCSGNGVCQKFGVCACKGDYTGDACQHGQLDLVAVASGSDHFQVSSGSYKYFRVRVPPTFAGGYLRVELTATSPVIVLVRDDVVPTKGEFQYSNFDDWLNKSLNTVMKVAVPSGRDPLRALSRSFVPRSRRLNASEAQGAARFLDVSDRGVQCPSLPQKSLDTRACGGTGFVRCLESCSRCMECVPGDTGCNLACSTCKSASCYAQLSACARDLTCSGPVAQECGSHCSGCMACVGSNDRRCATCGCCAQCFPVAAKCGLTELTELEYTYYIYVGVLNHRHFYNDAAGVDVNIHLELKEDSTYSSHAVPGSWLAELYNPFLDLRNFETEPPGKYKGSHWFLFDVRFVGQSQITATVKLYRDRLTLLRLVDAPDGVSIWMSFPGAIITHVLSTPLIAPKTFFDFDNIYRPNSQAFTLQGGEGQVRWCAIFGGADATIQMQARMESVVVGDHPTGSLQYSFMWVFVLLCCFVGLSYLYGGSSKFGSNDRGGLQLPERLRDLFAQRRAHESITRLTRDELGYEGCDIDHRVDEEYLNRGGRGCTGDDGI